MQLDEIIRELSTPNMRMIMNRLLESVVITDAEGLIRYHNEQFIRLTNSTGIGKNLFKDYPFDSPGEREKLLRDSIESGRGRLLGAVKYGNHDENTQKYFNIQIAPFADGAEVSLSDVTNEVLDGLTGAFSQSYLMSVLKEKEIERAKREEKKGVYHLALIGIDLKKFKRVNDAYGLDVGDQLLRDTVDILKSSVRAADYVIRRGGDEFFVLCPHTDEKQLETVRERIEKKVADYNQRVKNPDLKLSLYLFSQSTQTNYSGLFESVSNAIKAQEGSSRTR